MKKFFIYFSPLVFVFIVGCSGNDGAPPPQPPQLNLNNQTDQQQLQAMAALAQQTKSSCAQSGTASLSAVLPFVAAGPGAQSGFQSGAIPTIPPISGDCSNSVANLLAMYSTMKGGLYANDPSTRPWIISQLGGIVSRVGANLEQQLGRKLTSEEQQKLIQASWGIVQRDVLNNPQLQGVKPAVCSGSAQFGLSC